MSAALTADAQRLLVVDTGEVVDPLTREEASSLSTRIAVKLDAIADNYESVMPMIQEAITRRAHLALGYKSPGAYVADRFGKALSRLGSDLRRQVVGELAAAGLSTRAIAPVVGASQRTVVRELHVTGESSDSPVEVADAPLTQAECEALDEARHEPRPSLASVQGLDGKHYSRSSARAPKTPQRRALVDEFRSVITDAESVTKRIEKLTADDRFKSNAGQIAEKYLSDLTRARDALQRVIDQLN